MKVMVMADLPKACEGLGITVKEYEDAQKHLQVSETT